MIPAMRRAAAAAAVLASVGIAQDEAPSKEDWKKAQADVAADAKAIEAKNAKMAAVDKVVSLLEGLRSKVMEEGESEAETYNKFGCFCKDTTADKTAAIQAGTDETQALSTTIEELSTERETLDTSIETLVGEIKDAEKAMAEAESERAATLKTYQTNEGDLRGAIEALSGAIKAMKASKTPSLVQIQGVAKTVNTAVLLADALGLDADNKKGGLAALLQAAEDPDNSVPMQDYDFHSGGIIETLEKLQADFRTEKVTVDAAEVESVKAHDSFMQEKTDLLKMKNKDLEDDKKSKSQKQEQIASTSERRTTVAAVLLDDQAYLSELSTMCSDKAKTWDQRTQVRQDELSALTSAIAIIKTSVAEKTQAATIRFAQQAVSVRLAEVVARTPEAMERFEEEAEEADDGEASAPVAFLQKKQIKKVGAAPRPSSRGEDGRQLVADMLSSEGQKLKSTLLTALASQITADPFAKVKVLVQELIDRLLNEASNEANQKGWCDKAMADAKQKRDYAAEAVEQHNAEMAGLEATRDKLAEELGVLETEIADLISNRDNATKLREEEKAENEFTVTEAQAGLEAVSSAIDILDKYYKTVAKEKVDLSLAQQKKGPADDVPDAGFKNGEAYTGAQGEAGGILGMLDVIKSDFERTVAETEKAEAAAEADHLVFMTDSGKSLAEKQMAEGEQKKQKDETEASLEEADSNLDAQMEILTGSVKELLELKPACVDTGMSYEDRVARREEEIAALKKADCILGAYAEYGPDGLADAC